MKKLFLYTKAFIYALYRCVSRRIPTKYWGVKKQSVAKKISLIMVGLMIVSSLMDTSSMVDVNVIDVANVQRHSATVNQVYNGDRSAEVVLNNSKVSRDEKGQSASDMVVTKEYEDYGAHSIDTETVCKYQFPVEIGQDIHLNYSQQQNKEDYVHMQIDTVDCMQPDEVVEKQEETAPTEESYNPSEETVIEPAENEATTEEEVIDNSEDSTVSNEEQVQEEIVGTDTGGKLNKTVKEEQPVVPDASFYIVSGAVHEGNSVFVGDVTIKARGVKGYNLVRIGSDGDFSKEVVITKDAEHEELSLYFSNGDDIIGPTIYTYSKDSIAPVLLKNSQNTTDLSSKHYVVHCTNKGEIEYNGKDQDKATEEDVHNYNYIFGNQQITDNNGILKMEESFYGRVMANCQDVAGNTSNVVDDYYLIEKDAPKVNFSNGEICTAPYTLWIGVEDKGDIVSGINEVVCTVNGKKYNQLNLQSTEDTVLGMDLKVSTKAYAPVVLEKGNNHVEVYVKDNAGNEVIEKRDIEVSEPKLVSVSMPREFAIHIDPYRIKGKRQLYSDKLVLENTSDFDVIVSIKNISLFVGAENGKEATVYVVAPDTGALVKLDCGENDDVYSFCIPKGQKQIQLYFVGDIKEGTEAFWNDSDVSIKMKLDFNRKE